MRQAGLPLLHSELQVWEHVTTHLLCNLSILRDHIHRGRGKVPRLPEGFANGVGELHVRVPERKSCHLQRTGDGDLQLEQLVEAENVFMGHVGVGNLNWMRVLLRLPVVRRHARSSWVLLRLLGWLRRTSDRATPAPDGIVAQARGLCHQRRVIRDHVALGNLRDRRASPCRRHNRGCPADGGARPRAGIEATSEPRVTQASFDVEPLQGVDHEQAPHHAFGFLGYSLPSRRAHVVSGRPDLLLQGHFLAIEGVPPAQHDEQHGAEAPKVDGLRVAAATRFHM
mmetsp:Transcript_43130/g.125573  ORF Transcript_43130/g.125573 Transcript_43130/m.125573 type:complete len:283 (-) Transcript_43130:762-1610(-)